MVNDCYNANPMSMRAALDHLAESAAARRVAVLGAMAELGDGSERYHREIGAHAAALGIDVLVPVGEDALGYARGLRRRDAPGRDARGGRRRCSRSWPQPGDRVLSRARARSGLERVARRVSRCWARS